MNSGKRTPRRKLRAELGARDRRIMDEVIRLRVLTNEAVRALFMPTSSLNAATKVTARLAKQGWLNSFEYIDRCQYFVAGLKTVQTFGIPTSRVRPLGPQALATHLAMLDFVSRSTPRLRVMTEREIAEFVASEAETNRGIPHAVEVADPSEMLRLVRVDLGGTPAHLVSKLNADIRSRVSNSQYASLVAAKKLVLVTLTATDTKKSLIESTIRKKSWPTGLRFSVFVTPVLCHLLGGFKSNVH